MVVTSGIWGCWLSEHLRDLIHSKCWVLFRPSLSRRDIMPRWILPPLLLGFLSIESSQRSPPHGFYSLFFGVGWALWFASNGQNLTKRQDATFMIKLWKLWFPSCWTLPLDFSICFLMKQAAMLEGRTWQWSVGSLQPRALWDLRPSVHHSWRWSTVSSDHGDLGVDSSPLET